ncbi:MAG TPA: SIS domain-containing protein [Bdellovibrionales bacterium]|nr:SIS domain-containing protein [Bdellovibrionales bacterium]
MKASEFASNYLKETLPLFKEYEGEVFQAAMGAMVEAYHRGSTIFICGNGGSWGTSNHMVNDLAKGSVAEGKKRLRVIGLGDNTSLLTAYANDCGYETIFLEPLKGLFKKGDILIAISASGNSPNVVKAAEYVRTNGGQTIGLIGFSGGKLKELSDFPIHFKSHNYGSVEDAQLMFSHLSSQFLHQYIKTSGPAFEAAT